MTSTTTKTWLYTKNGRYYADFRSYRDVGGGQEAMKPAGERYATKEEHVAERLMEKRLAELERLREAGHTGEEANLRYLGPFVDYHLEAEVNRYEADQAHVEQVAQRLEVAVEFFGADALVGEITTMRLQKYVGALAKRRRWEGRENPGTKTIKPTTQRKYLSDLRKLFRRARSVGILPRDYRPFKDLMDLPKAEPSEAEWLDGPVAALLLEAARLYEPKRKDLAVPCAYTIIATLLLTGLRPSEGLGLRIEDLDFERKLIRVRRNWHRPLKTPQSRRLVPMWPQLEAILRAYLERMGNPAKGILFPSPKVPGKPVQTIKKLVAELAERIDYGDGLTPKAFRHSYCAARIQTTDNGEPVALFKVARELGHASTDMVQQIYGHVSAGLATGPRKPVVEFRLEDYEEKLAGELEAMRARTRERNGFAPALANRVAPEVEMAVLEAAATMPRRGPKKVAANLEANGFEVSPSGVRWIWKRYELHRSEYRLDAIESGRLAEVMEEVRALRMS